LNVEEISIVREWKDEARREVQRDNLLRILAKRFPPGAPTDMAQSIQQTMDLQQLSGWLDAAQDAPSLESFRGSMGLPSGSNV
jgi:hypothetical protein